MHALLTDLVMANAHSQGTYLLHAAESFLRS